MSSVYKTAEEAYASLKTNLEKRIGDEIQVGSVIDMFNHVIADEVKDMYDYIEANKNPYLFTNTWGSDLDSIGYWVGISRELGEDDDHYKYRLKDWCLSNEKSNTTAIENAVLSPKSASNIQYVPYTHGSGTATCYVIPSKYEEENISAALVEAKALLADTVSPSLYIEYLVPAMRAVKLNCYLVTDGDEASIRSNIETQIADYVNSIAPGNALSIGDILKLGLNTDGVEYFNVLTYFIDNDQQDELKTVQELETKFIFDEILWSR